MRKKRRGVRVFFYYVKLCGSANRSSLLCNNCRGCDKSCEGYKHECKSCVSCGLVVLGLITAGGSLGLGADISVRTLDRAIAVIFTCIYVASVKLDFAKLKVTLSAVNLKVL